MIVTGKRLPRRTVLRGLGATLSLPLLDAMVPAFAPLRLTAANPVRRLGVVYLPMGMNMALWTPPKEGALEITPIMRPLEAFRDRLLVLSGLDSKPADGRDGGVHPRVQASWLTGVTAKRTEGPDLRAGTSMDQIAAREIGEVTQLASLELATESVDFVGACVLGYSCAYTGTLSWRAPTSPLPMEDNPRAVFERLFGDSGTTDPRTRLADMRRRRSILDGVSEKLGHLETRLGPSDQSKLGQYLDAVRDVERRIQKAEEQVGQELPVVSQPTGVPSTYEDYVKLMFDLLTLAYQCDLTRVSTFMLARELSARTYPEIGVPEPHHPFSHHGNNPEKLATYAKLNTFHTKMFAYFVEKLAATSDGDGSLLDHSLLLFGSGLSDSNLHLMFDVPTMVVGGSLFQVKGGRHLRFPKTTPLTNLQLTLLDKMGVRIERFGDSTGSLNLLSDV